MCARARAVNCEMGRRVDHRVTKSGIRDCENSVVGSVTKVSALKCLSVAFMCGSVGIKVCEIAVPRIIESYNEIIYNADGNGG